MSSINTNLSAMTALQSLKATQTAMNKNQNQISTGLRVGEASHNASYWSISTKMKSDNGALGAVKDSLKQSKEMINTFSAAMKESLGYLNTMKTKLAAGSNPGADLKSIQTELKSSIEGLKSIAGSATFNGQNWLKSEGETVKLVTSYDGQAKELKFLDIDTSKINLFSSAAGPDILGTAGTSGVAVDDIDVSNAARPSTLTFGVAADISEGDVLTFKLGSGAEQKFAIDSTMSDIDDLVEGINNDSTLGALVEAKKVTTAGVDSLVLTSKLDGQNLSGSYSNLRAEGTATAGTTSTPGSLDIDVSGAVAGDVLKFKVGNEELEFTVGDPGDIATDLAAKFGTDLIDAPAVAAGTLTITAANNNVNVTGDLFDNEVAATAAPSVPGSGTSVANALKSVDEAINKITEGMAMLGANKALIESQEEFIGVLSDSLTAGVSAFVDADMNEVSTRNQALQTQQQLGVQALSMANQNSQMILKLFQ